MLPVSGPGLSSMSPANSSSSTNTTSTDRQHNSIRLQPHPDDPLHLRAGDIRQYHNPTLARHCAVSIIAREVISYKYNYKYLLECDCITSNCILQYKW